MKKVGRPTDFNEDFHPEDLMKRMEQGELDVQVYAAWRIAKSTFETWKTDSEKLEEAYQIGIAACEAWWLARMKERWLAGDDKGFKYCALIVNTKFGYRENQSANSITNNTQINVSGGLNLVNSKNRQELLDFIKQGVVDNNIIDVKLIDNDS